MLLLLERRPITATEEDPGVKIQQIDRTFLLELELDGGELVANASLSPTRVTEGRGAAA